MATEIKDIRSKPLYDSTTGKLRGWNLSWNCLEPEFGDCFWSVMPKSRFFAERWYRNSYKAMLRVKNDLLAKQNENNK